MTQIQKTGGFLSLCAAAWRYLTKAPLPSSAANRFSTVKLTADRKFVPAALGIILIETLAVHFFVEQIETEWLRLAVHILLFGLEIYTLVWLVADFRMLEETGHSVSKDGIDLRLGTRMRVFVPREHIRKVVAEPYTEPEVALLKGEAKQNALTLKTRTLKVTPSAAPNIWISLAKPTQVTLVLGITRKPSELRVYVDDPKGFIEACEGAGLPMGPS